MAKHNTHRASGRAVTPVSNARRAARGFGGAAVLGTVLMGTAFAGSGTQAAAAAPATAPSVAQSAPALAPAAPEAAAPTAALTSKQKLRKGSRGPAVEDLQRALNDAGANLAVDGVFGFRTLGAVKNYQASHGLQVDGVVGPETRGSLNGGAAISGGGTSAAATTSGTGSAIVERARSVIGTGYTWAGSSTSTGFDCSGLVKYAYQAAGINLPHQSGSISNGGRWISQSEAQPGDIVAYSGHVAIYAGNGKIIDASRSKDRVVERAIWGNPIGFVTYR